MQPQAQTLSENLVALLNEETSIYEELAALLEVEQIALLGMDVAKLGELTSRKETLALRLKGLDESRKIIARRLGQLLGVPSTSITVTRLAQAARGLDGERLARAAERLKAVVLLCQERNADNGRAARKGLELTTSAIEYLLKPGDPAGRVYQAPYGGSRGYAAPGSRPAQAPGLISRQV
jgi:flagellar biosynthesis/type III secretory pathway chaperone